MGRLKRFPCKFLEELAWNLLMQALLPVVGGGAMIGLFTGFLAWLAKLPWHIIVIIAIFAFLVSMIAIELKRSGLKIRFCEASGRITNNIPEARYWEWATGSICYCVSGYFRVSNLGMKKRTLEDSYVVLMAKGKELMRQKVHRFPRGVRVRSLDTTPTPVRLFVQPFADELILEQVVGRKFAKAKVILVVEATGTKAKVTFHNLLGPP